MRKKALRCRHIYTGNSAELLDGYVVIEGNKIKFVGNEQDSKDYIDSGTELIDVRSSFVMPGFHDYHVHLVNGGVLERDGILRYTKSPEEAADFLWQRHKKTAGNKWILGGAWDPLLWPDSKPPTKEILDRYFPNTPVFLINKECHGAWVNSEALRKFHITKDTPDPEHGYYQRDGDGEPSGYLHETAAIKMQDEIFSSIDDEDIAQYALCFLKTANKHGITSLGDVAGGAPMRPSAYKMLEDRNDLTGRIHFSLFFDEGVEKIRKMQQTYCSSILKCMGVKTFIDGTPQGYSGYMLQDYSDRPGSRGEAMIEPEEFVKMVCEFDAAGIQTRVHACGDAGARLCLDAVEAARQQNGNQGVRHCVEHLESMSPQDIPRFGQLGVIASVQPEHMPKYDFAQHPFHKILGEERMKYSWPFESIRRQGGILAFGTDCPVVDISPFRGIFRAVTRLTNDLEPKGGWNPQERVSIHEALKAYTRGGAFAAGREQELGTLESGKLADIAVVEHNIFDYASDRKAMFDMEVCMTIADGEIVYEKIKK